MKITPGLWKTRNGRIAFVSRVQGGYAWGIAIDNNESSVWNLEGMTHPYVKESDDLIAPYTAPVVYDEARERKAFERWANLDGLSINKNNYGIYFYESTRSTWEGWEARAQLNMGNSPATIAAMPEQVMGGAAIYENSYVARENGLNHTPPAKALRDELAMAAPITINGTLKYLPKGEYESKNICKFNAKIRYEWADAMIEAGKGK